jgi:Ser/Thr protein kinase RdoA (MazF antagonist)
MIAASGPEAALSAWPEAAGLPLRRIARGLVNQTWAAGEEPRFALQLVHPQFGEVENRRIAAAGGLLEAAGIGSPELLPAADGALSIPGPQGRSWRLARWLPGDAFDRLPTPEHARSAGRLLARFHDTIADLPDLPRSAFHDTEARMADLRRAFEQSRDDALRQLAAAILDAWRAWSPEAPPDVEPRPGHGDPKLSNFLFQGVEATAIIDLDTLGLYRIDDELGDALRSWSNAFDENAAPQLDEAAFAAAVAGYVQSSQRLTRPERDRIVHGFARIALELAARFCADAHDDCYFAWDPAAAPSRKAHNLLRAGRQLALARLVIGRRAQLEEIVRTTA